MTDEVSSIQKPEEKPQEVPQTDENDEPPKNYQPLIWTAAENGDLESVKYSIRKYPHLVNRTDMVLH